MTHDQREPADVPAPVHDCPLCRALLRVAESIVEAEAEAAERDGAEQRRVTIGAFDSHAQGEEA